VEGLRAAIRDYEEKHGLITERVPTTVDVVKKRLRHVMNPLTGLDVVRTELIKDITVDKGIVKVQVDLKEDHQFAAAIKEDIKDKIEPLWDVKTVTVEFLG
jgi:nitrogen fixation NifU-like protein